MFLLDKDSDNCDDDDDGGINDDGNGGDEDDDNENNYESFKGIFSLVKDKIVGIRWMFGSLLIVHIDE